MSLSQSDFIGSLAVRYKRVLLYANLAQNWFYQLNF